MINSYDNHFWMCPLCKKKYNLYNHEKNYDYNNEDDKNNKKENKKYYQTEKYKKKFKKYINSDNEYIKTKILKKNINNARYINEKQIPHSYRNFGKKLTNIDEDNLPFKTYKSGINENLLISNNLYNNTDERLNTNFLMNIIKPNTKMIILKIKK